MCHPEFLDSFPFSSPIMDRSRLDQSCGDSYSRPARSRASSSVSVTAAQLGNIRLAENSPDLRPERSPSTASSHYISPTPSRPSSYLPTPISQTYSPFPLLSPNILNAEWNDDDVERNDSNPLLRVDPAQDYSSTSTSSSLPPGEAGIMSVVALQFDPTFAMGTRSAFTWPGKSQSLRIQTSHHPSA
jgi:hypothetical protein